MSTTESKKYPRTITIQVEPADVDRLDALIEKSGVPAKRGTQALGMLRRGMDEFERNFARRSTANEN